MHNSVTFSCNFCVIADHFDRQSSLDDNIEEASGGGSAANSQRSIEVLYAGAGGKPSQSDGVKVSWSLDGLLIYSQDIPDYQPGPGTLHRSRD